MNKRLLISIGIFGVIMLGVDACQKVDASDQFQVGDFKVIHSSEYVTLIVDTKYHCEYIDSPHGVIHRIGDSCSYNNPKVDEPQEINK